MTAIEARWGDALLSVGTDPNPPRVQGQHAFVATALFRVKRPRQGEFLLDRENLFAVVPAFCWWCRATSDDGSPCL